MYFEMMITAAFLCVAAYLCLKAFVIAIDRARLAEQNEFLQEQLELQEERRLKLQAYQMEQIMEQVDKPFIDYLLAKRLGQVCEYENEQPEKPPLRVHGNETPTQRPRPARPNFSPSFVYEETQDETPYFDDDGETEIFRQPEIRQIGMTRFGYLPYFDDDVIDVPVIHTPAAPTPHKRRGRPKKYQSDADKQRAYRERNRE